MRRHTRKLALILAILCNPVFGEEPPVPSMVWDVDSLGVVGGHEVTVVGSPRVVDTSRGRALEFDGVGDGIFLDVHPLAGARVFTVEVVFQPYPNGLKEQRFFHMQESASDRRVMFETRLTDDDRWFLDTYIKAGDEGHALYAEEFKHPIGPWYHAAIVVDGESFRHYVNGELEMSTEIDFAPHGPGRTSLGVRQNLVYWYKGAIRKARFTRAVLSPEQFLTP